MAALYGGDRPFAESRFATFAAIRLHHRVWEPAGDPLGKIMMIHGVGGSTASFDRIAPKLAALGYSVVAVDLPAFGWSSVALDFAHTLESRSSLLWTLADRLDTEENRFGPARRWVLVGHAMGGQVATRMALDRQARMESLVVIASTIADAEHPGRSLRFPPVRWALRGWLGESLYTREGVEELLGAAYGRGATEQEIDRYTAPLLRPDMREAYVNYLATAGAVDLEIEALTAPLLVIWGAQDGNAPPVAADRIVARVPSADVRILPDAAHVPTDTHPEEILSILAGWLDAH